MLITLIRHGSTEGRPYVFRGRSDPALSQDGWTQLERAAKSWETPRIDKLYASPSRRCITFAREWALARNAECVTAPALCEIDFGAWEEHSPEEARVQNQKCFESMMSDLENWSAPGGEAYRDFRSRVLSAFDEIRSSRAEHVGVLTHGGVIRVLLCEILGMSAVHAQRIVVDYGCTCRVWNASSQDRRLLALVNT